MKSSLPFWDFFVYLISIVLMTLALTLSGLDEITAFSAAVACLNNLGAGLGAVGPAMTYASLNDFQIWLCSFGMFLGRLEFYTLMIVFTPPSGGDDAAEYSDRIGSADNALS